MTATKNALSTGLVLERPQTVDSVADDCCAVDCRLPMMQKKTWEFKLLSTKSKDGLENYSNSRFRLKSMAVCGEAIVV